MEFSLCPSLNWDLAKNTHKLWKKLCRSKTVQIKNLPKSVPFLHLDWCYMIFPWCLNCWNHLLGKKVIFSRLFQINKFNNQYLTQNWLDLVDNLKKYDSEELSEFFFSNSDFAVLHSNELHYIALCCTILYYLALFCTILHCTTLHFFSLTRIMFILLRVPPNSESLHPYRSDS